MNDGAPGELWRRSAAKNHGTDYAEQYAAHFDRLAASGQDVHGEATLVAELTPTGGRVLDAGCGTGRIAAHLADLGYAAVGVDVDETMIGVARSRRPDVDWHVADLAAMDLGVFDTIVSAGNVIPFLEPSTYPQVAVSLRRHLHEDGVLLVGFGLDREHLPDGALEVDWDAFTAACTEAGLALVERFGGWGREAATDGYVVGVFRASVT